MVLCLRRDVSKQCLRDRHFDNLMRGNERWLRGRERRSFITTTARTKSKTTTPVESISDSRDGIRINAE